MTIVTLLFVLGLRRFDLAWAPMWVAPNRVGNAVAPMMQWAEKRKFGENLVWLFAVVLPVILWHWLYVSVGVWLGSLLAGALLLWLLGAESELRYLEGLIQRALMRDKEQFEQQAGKYFNLYGDVEDDTYLPLLMRRILQQESTKVFALLFWLFVGGFWAALLYALNYACMQRQTGLGLATFLHRLMSWLPNRLLVVALALVGSFRGATEESERYWWAFNDGSALLAAAMPQALDLPETVHELAPLAKAEVQLKALQSIILRCLALWLIFGVLWYMLVG